MANSTPHVGKIQELYDANNRNLYSRPSPYTENSGVFSFGPRQPFVYTKINDGKKGLNRMKRFDSQAFPFISSLIDTKRIAKFMVTGNGLIFLTKQFFLQKNQAFNETRIYNPLSPLLAVSTRLNPFSDRNPSRFIDTSGGAMGILKSLIGLPSKTVPAPPGTVGLGALSEKNKSSAKGLIRAHTAINGYNRLTGVDPKKTSLLASLKSLFSFKAQSQPENASFRADEGGYGIQLKPGKGKYDYFTADGSPVKWGEDYYMRFEAGKHYGTVKENIKKSFETSATTSIRENRLLRIFGKDVPRSSIYTTRRIGRNFSEKDLKVGYDETDKYNKHFYIRYGDNVGQDRIKLEGQEFKFSNILSIYTLYKRDKNFDIIYGEHIGQDRIKSERDQPTTRFSNIREKYENYTREEVKTESKFNDKTDQSFKMVEASLKKVIDKINDKKSTGYKFSGMIVQQFSNPKFVGMDAITELTKKINGSENAVNYSGSYDNSLKDNINHIDKKKGFAGTHRPDKVNSLTILDKDGVKYKTSNVRKNDTEKTYNPYKDDQIAFYFHDLVNDKYIPFRATVKGLNEQLSSQWSDISYIGRADKLYNYIGFTRSINFSFSISAMSLTELLPMWVRVNYLATLVKPSKYTSTKSGDDYIIPPMTTITIGDLYKEQPFVIKTVGITIPEDALWETTSENRDTSDWSYLNGKIVFKDSNNKGMFAQFPRECDITVGGELLEREQPMVGRANFGGSGNFSDRLKTIL